MAFQLIAKEKFDKQYRDHLRWLENPAYGTRLIFNDINFHDSKLELNDLVFINVDFINCILPINIKNSKFTLCKLINTNLVCIEFNESEFNYCHIENSNFYCCKNITEYTFYNCNIKENRNIPDKFKQFLTNQSPCRNNLPKIPNHVKIKLTQQQLDLKNEDHIKWLNSNGAEGKQLDLSICNLVYDCVSGYQLNISKINFKNAICEQTVFPSNCFFKLHFVGTNLQNADFTYCDFDNLIFEKCNLKGSNFTNAIFNQTPVCVNCETENIICRENWKKYFVDATPPREIENKPLIISDETHYSKDKIQNQNIPIQNTPLRKMTDKEYINHYINHREWLCNKSKGKQLCIENADISDVGPLTGYYENAIFKNVKFPPDCSGIRLVSADLENCDFSNSELGQANFTNSNCYNLNFENIDVTNCNFTNAKLRDIKSNENTKINDDVLKRIVYTKQTANTRDEKQPISLDKEETQMTTSNSATPAVPSNPFVSGLVDQLKKSFVAGTKQAGAKQLSKIITKGVSGALIKAKIPRSVVRSKLGQVLISILGPQALALAVPYVPKLKNSPKLIAAINAAMEASMAQVTGDAMGKIWEGLLPAFGPMFAQLMAVEIPAIDTTAAESSTDSANEYVVEDR